MSGWFWGSSKKEEEPEEEEVDQGVDDEDTSKSVAALVGAWSVVDGVALALRRGVSVRVAGGAAFWGHLFFRRPFELCRRF